MSLILGVIKASSGCDSRLILVTIIALVMAAILFGVVYFRKSDVNP